MATLTASHFVSRNSANGGPISGSETKKNLAQMGLRSRSMTHNGLRTLNKVDMLQMRTNEKAIARQAGRNKPKTNCDRPSKAIVCSSGMNLVFVAAEVAPWSKTGGLGDVLGGLRPAMAANGHRVMTVSPRYDQYKDAWDTNVLVGIKVGDKIEKVRFFHCYKRGVDHVFVDHPSFLEKVEHIPLPLLVMRTVLQAIGAFPSLVEFIMEILARLVSKQVTENTWERYILKLINPSFLLYFHTHSGTKINMFDGLLKSKFYTKWCSKSAIKLLLHTR